MTVKKLRHPSQTVQPEMFTLFTMIIDNNIEPILFDISNVSHST